MEPFQATELSGIRKNGKAGRATPGAGSEAAPAARGRTVCSAGMCTNSILKHARNMP